MANEFMLGAGSLMVHVMCKGGYKWMKSFLLAKQAERNRKRLKAGKEELAPAHDDGGGAGVSAEHEANDDSGGHSGPVMGGPVMGDQVWLEELHKLKDQSSRDNLRLLEELKTLVDEIKRVPFERLIDDLNDATNSLIEYLERPNYERALDQAHRKALTVYGNKRSLVLSLSALRLRVILEYIDPKEPESATYDKGEHKRICQDLISKTLKGSSLKLLCKEFLAGCDGEDKQLRDRVEREATLAFDIILEVVSGVYMLEPFVDAKKGAMTDGPPEFPLQAFLPKGAPEIVLHALSAYHKRELGSSRIYTDPKECELGSSRIDLKEALDHWEFTAGIQDKWPLHCLYKKTSGPGWSCSEGWPSLFEVDDLSSLYGVSVEGGRVTKISLAANNLEGHLPQQLGSMSELREISLHGNKLLGEIPAALWSLPALRVVALHGNKLRGTPPEKFKPATSVKASSTEEDALLDQPRSQPLGIAARATVEACHPGRMEVYTGEWFTCKWKITNTGGVPFSKATKLQRVPIGPISILGGELKDSKLGGMKELQVNPLQPGEEHTVSVMQKAPVNETFEVEDVWELKGESTDFAFQEEARRAKTPTIDVYERHATGGGGGKGDGDERGSPTVADTVFVVTDTKERPRFSEGSRLFGDTVTGRRPG